MAFEPTSASYYSQGYPPHPSAPQYAPQPLYPQNDYPPPTGHYGLPKKDGEQTDAYTDASAPPPPTESENPDYKKVVKAADLGLHGKASDIQDRIAKITLRNCLSGDRVNAKKVNGEWEDDYVYRDHKPEKRSWHYTFFSINMFNCCGTTHNNYGPHQGESDEEAQARAIAIGVGVLVVAALAGLFVNITNHSQHRNMAMDIEAFRAEAESLSDEAEKHRYKSIADTLENQNNRQDAWNITGLAMAVAIVAAGIVALVGFCISMATVLYAGAFIAAALAVIGIVLFITDCAVEGSINATARRVINM